MLLASSKVCLRLTVDVRKEIRIHSKLFYCPLNVILILISLAPLLTYLR